MNEPEDMRPEGAGGVSPAGAAESPAARRVFLVDGNSYVYRAFFATPHLSNSRGVPTNATYAFLSMIRKLVKEQKPDGLAVIFDSKVPSFREEISKEYKAQRPPMPSNLAVQFPYIKDLLRAMGISSIEVEGFEADDIIATLTERLLATDAGVIIVTSDKDMMQLVSPRVLILDTAKNVLIGEAEVVAKLGAAPSQVVDYLALAGDTSDNIPGVPGVGEKTARELLTGFGSIEAIYAGLEAVPRPALRDKLAKGKPLAEMSRQLATLRRDVPLEDWEAMVTVADEDRDRLRGLLKELEFTSLYREIEVRERPRAVWKEAELAGLAAGKLALFAHISGKGSRDVALEAFAAFDGEGVFFSTKTDDFFALLDNAREVVVHNLKPLTSLALGCDRRFNVSFFDTMLAAYLTNPLRKEYGIESLLEERLDRMVPAGSGKEALMERAVCLFELQKNLEGAMEEQGLTDLFTTIEMPLIEVLAAMEFTGVRVERQMLGLLSRDFDRRLTVLAREIYDVAGESFNVNSPQQLSRILFDVLKLPPSKKTKTGYSTDTEVLQALSALHGLPAKVLDYRSLAKLKGTYIDALPNLINPASGRVHTTYNQMVVATGRLSSTDPNLQNIPIRGEEGRKIREAFVAPEGCLLLSSDYSQIELRVLAHLSRDPVLVEAFMADQDIHSRVAQEVFGVTAEGVTQDMRRAAKVINFGIIYGMSGFGLAKELGVSQREAQQYIDEYFVKHRGVKAFIDATLEIAREKGFVRTLYGRVRYIPELQSSDTAMRQFGERIAMNTPIQGTAADIIKMAMVNIYRRIDREGFRSHLIMQIHDELVFEVPEEELSGIQGVVRDEMERVVPFTVPLKVSLGHGKSWADAHD